MEFFMHLLTAMLLSTFVSVAVVEVRRAFSITDVNPIATRHAVVGKIGIVDSGNDSEVKPHRGSGRFLLAS